MYDSNKHQKQKKLKKNMDLMYFERKEYIIRVTLISIIYINLLNLAENILHLCTLNFTQTKKNLQSDFSNINF